MLVSVREVRIWQLVDVHRRRSCVLGYAVSGWTRTLGALCRLLAFVAALLARRG